MKIAKTPAPESNPVNTMSFLLILELVSSEIWKTKTILNNFKCLQNKR